VTGSSEYGLFDKFLLNLFRNVGAHNLNCVGRDSSVGIATGRSGDRVPVGARFFTPVQTSPGAQPASCTMGNGSFPEVKRPEHGVDHPRPSSAKVKEGVKLHLYSPSGLSWPVLG